MTMKTDSILAHIEAFRRMIIEILAIFIVLLIPGWCAAPKVLFWMQNAAVQVAKRGGADFSLSYFSLMEPFLIELKCGAVLAFAVGLPLYFWRIWAFVAPALYRHEKRVILPGALAAWGLFAAGFAMGLLLVMPMLVKFSLGFAREGLMPVIGIGNFISMAMTVSLAFGIMFELPLLLLILAAAGIVELATLRKQRPLVIVLILFLAALLTPPDIVSQLMLAVPTYCLFEVMLLVAGCILKKKATAGTEDGGVAGESAGSDPDAAEISDVALTAADSDGAYTYPAGCYRHQRRRRKAPGRNKRGKGYMNG
jgi:sec-independent protein translocase protein TatC